jgi:hypothetical protein
MKLKFTVTNGNGVKVADGEFVVPDEIPAVQVQDYINVKYLEIVRQIVDVKFDFATPDDEKAFKTKWEEETKKSSIVGLDGNPIDAKAKIITMN